MENKKIFGVIAQFDNSSQLLKAVEKLTQLNIKGIETHTPFPVHGMDKAMGLKDSRLGWIVAFCAVMGFIVGIGLQGWTATIAYPMTVSGKPFFSWQAFIPITFELTILFSAFGTVFGMFALNKLPRFHHPLFFLPHFKSFSTDGFFLSIEAKKGHFDVEATKTALKKVGGWNIQEVFDE